METMATETSKEAFPWHMGVFDAHCHPTDTVATLTSIPSMKAKVLTVMATRGQDQSLVAELATEIGLSSVADAKIECQPDSKHKVIPAFGWHPWFSHQMFFEVDYGDKTELDQSQKIAHYRSVLQPAPEDEAFMSSLPNPRPFRRFLVDLRSNLLCFPLALVGEVGLDRSFRIPEDWLPGQVKTRDENLTPGGREGRRLSPYRVHMEHQKRILLAQLNLAGELQRATSVHGVQAHGIVHDTLALTWRGHEREVLSRKERKREADALVVHAMPQKQLECTTQPQFPAPFPPRLCLHSFSGSADTVKQYIKPSIPCTIFFSFSTTINSWTESGNGKVEAAVRAVPDDRILIESDLHTAGEDMDQYLEGAVRKVCEVKGWGLQEGVRQLRENWLCFAFGDA